MTPYRATSGTLTLSDGVQTLTIPYADGAVEWVGGEPKRTCPPDGDRPVSMIDGSIVLNMTSFRVTTRADLFDPWATYLAVVRRAEEVGRRRRAHRRTVRRQRRAKRGWR